MLHPYSLVLLALPLSVIVLAMIFLLYQCCKCWLQDEALINDVASKHPSYEDKGTSGYRNKNPFCFSKGGDSGHNASWIWSKIVFTLSIWFLLIKCHLARPILIENGSDPLHSFCATTRQPSRYFANQSWFYTQNQVTLPFCFYMLSGGA